MTISAWTDLDDKSVKVARALALDAVETAGHGHPGTAMALAPVAHLLFNKFMNHSPDNPEWFGRDRFILSCGHASMLLYSQLFLNGYGLEIEDLKNFRKMNSLTPGHPEFQHTKGVEMTTGPLGQGLSSAVGMAMASRYWRNYFDAKTATNQSIFDNYIYVVASDGDLQEGVTSEASSLAGHLGLANLIVIYDDNRISIDGDTNLAFTEDVATRYRAYNWDVQTVELGADGQVDISALSKAIAAAKLSEKPSFIQLKTIIAWPAPNARNTASAHGAPLGESETKLTKKALGFDQDKSFQVSDEVLNYTRQSQNRGAELFKKWNENFQTWASANPSLASDYQRLLKGELTNDLDKKLTVFESGTNIASRKSGGTILNELSSNLVELVGGSADLAESNGVALKNAKSMQRLDSEIANSSIGGKYLHFGIREHAMGSIMNGMALYGFTRPFGATFLIFSDYQKPAIRLASLMQLPVTYVWTHDSIGVGEDGPTHQPIEHFAALRAIPGFDVIRPGDANEVTEAWKKIITRGKACGILLSRQNLPVFDRTTCAPASGTAKGAYILKDAENPKAILIATGSEVSLAIDAQSALAAEGINVRVVSAPCLEWFAEQDQSYKDSVLSPDVVKISIEVGIAQGWRELIGDSGVAISLEHYGASADAKRLFKEFGFSVDNVVAQVKKAI